MKKILATGLVIVFGLIIYFSFLTPRQIPGSSPILVRDPIKEKISKMTLSEKVGQMLIIGFEHTYADEHITKMISQYGIGGVNLLRRNVASPEQMQELASSLQKLASSTSGIPFLIAVDQEGGNVIRFKFLKYTNPQLSLPSEQAAYNEAFQRGKELKDLGVNVNFAPVADYVTDSQSYLFSRTFATSSTIIARLAGAMREGYENAGIQAVVKHFPGYGNIVNDPHKKSVSTDRQIYEESLAPFRELLKNREDGAVMTAHIVIPEIDEKPATLSSYFLKKILREEWNYDGVIITDDLEMASAGRSSVPDIAVQAIKAGNDMIISTYTSSLHPQIHQKIVSAVENGEISIDDINKSVERILRFKKYH
jgi:beta-N-acetylhexosaminidase